MRRLPWSCDTDCTLVRFIVLLNRHAIRATELSHVTIGRVGDRRSDGAGRCRATFTQILRPCCGHSFTGCEKKTPPSLPHRAACPRLILWPPALDPASRRRSASTAAWMCARLMASGFSAWRVRSTYSNFIASLRHRSSALGSPASPATAGEAAMMRLKWQCAPLRGSATSRTEVAAVAPARDALFVQTPMICLDDNRGVYPQVKDGVDAGLGDPLGSLAVFFFFSLSDG